MSLPGVNTVIKDRFFGLSRTNIPLGPRVGIIARRNNDVAATPTPNTVANLDPFNAVNEQAVINAFGEGSDLHRGYMEALAGGASHVVLFALPGDTTFNDIAGTIESPTYDSETSNTGDLFSDAFAAVEAASIDIVVPWGRGSSPLEHEDPATPGNDPDDFGFYADNSAVIQQSWAYQVAKKCYEITSNSHPCFAVMGIKPFSGIATSDGGMRPTDVASHVALANLVDRNSTGMGNYGPYLSIVGTELKPVGYDVNYNWGFSNGAALYAGAITALDAWSAPTGKIIFNIDRAGVRYNPTRAQQQAMIDKGVVGVALNHNRVPTWVDAQTFSKDASDYRRLTTVRIVFNAVQMVRNVAQQFIGEASNTQTRNSLDTAITSGLRTMQNVGAVLDSDFTVSYIQEQNKAIVDLVLRPAFELRNIEVRVAINI